MSRTPPPPHHPLGYLWAAPCTAVGALLAALLLPLGARWRVRAGALEVALQGTPRGAPVRVPRLPFQAITLGHVIIGTRWLVLHRLRAHEQVHVRQYARWGALFFLAYPLASAWMALAGRDGYLDNPFEVAARRGSGPLWSVLLLAAVLAGCAPGERAPSAADTLPGTDSAAVAAAAPAVDSATLPTGSFAYVHADGRQLLALDSLFPPPAVRWAICPGGAVLPVRHAGRQGAKPGDSGRQRAANFDHQEGERYTVPVGAAPPDASCYLTADSALVAGVLSPAPSVPAACPQALKARLSAAEGRAVLGCWPLAAYAPGVTVAVAQLATVGREALAVLAVVDGDTLRLDRFPATVERPGQDLWRVDDRGIFHPETFRVPFAAHRAGALVVAVSWMGAEGENLYLLAPGRDPRGEAPAPLADFGRWHRGYRYLAPE